MTPPERAAAEASLAAARGGHVPVLLNEVITALSPRDNEVFLDGTFGAGGYARALLETAHCRVIGLDRDPDVLSEAADWASLYEDRLTLEQGMFGAMEDSGAAHAGVSGIVLDIGVSSMQLDRARRGFSFLRDGPLDMRMGQSGISAADLVNTADETVLADIFFQYGEERRSRALARAVVAARKTAPLDTTTMLADVIEQASPQKRPGQPHPATRVFQALRIAVNDELGQLADGLMAAERMLGEGGRLAVVTFHSLEDRVVKRFFQQRAKSGGAGVSRYAPDAPDTLLPSFGIITSKAVTAGEAELAQNPRARSAKLRAGRRTAAPAHPSLKSGLGLPGLVVSGRAL
ncbi:16S rRNA (cytosine(1402)-N(4))-methyltransferase RsmH [uncultured Tateyamaria sp.]|uniref:16S rRNA (cytosine(1402)-N(4))-methyltransferase RsmH n=1 Tax=uncultured Tateyamaria sp. TaxID=455651 RepID=UPI00262800B9|nr:16S rRNA (cytosine(1402)-N(4))-methyltransferase RsmH [uncultured Tateyamaria sp.]